MRTVVYVRFGFEKHLKQLQGQLRLYTGYPLSIISVPSASLHLCVSIPIVLAVVPVVFFINTRRGKPFPETRGYGR